MRKTGLIVAFLLLMSTFLVALIVLPGNVSAKTLYVGGSGPGNYTTIQGAIDDASPGDTVHVHSGTYYENVMVTKTLSLIGEDRDTTIINGSGAGDVVEITANWVNVTGFAFTNGGPVWGDAGIDLHHARNCHIANNSFSNSYHGIFLFSSMNNTIANNTISSNYEDGIYLRHSEGNIITSNNVLENEDGIELIDSRNNVVTNNVVSSNNHKGIYLEFSSNNTVDDNTALYNGDGIYLGSSGNNTVDDNFLLSNGDGIQLSNSSINLIERNNVLNNRYGIYLEYSTNNTVTENNALYNNDGIRLWYSNNSTIANNNALNNADDGIQLSFSLGNRMARNTFSSNKDDGIFLHSSNNNTIANNNALNNGDDGIEVSSSRDNRIANNTFSSNADYGIILGSSRNNWIYHNNLIHNRRQAYDSTGANQWDNGYPSGGNYWTDYAGRDEKSGPNQDQYGGDGIGDEPYAIQGGGSEDRYPLMSPFVPPPMLKANQPPICNITTPISGATVSGIYAITGYALDLDGMVERVEVRIDEGDWIRAVGITSWSYHLDTTNLTGGEHTIYARSYDGMNYSTVVNASAIVDNSVPQEPFFEQVWFWIAVTAVMVTILILVVLMERRRMKPEEE